MGSEQFTPGPWEVAEAFYKNGFYVFSPERGQGWVRKSRLDDCGAFKQEADARLIAAAPELYEVVAFIVSAIDSGTPEQHDEAEVIAKMRAALSKARGEQVK